MQYRSPCDGCHSYVCMCLFTWQLLTWAEKEFERICHSLMYFCFKDSGMVHCVGCFSALACLTGSCSVFCQLEKEVRSSVGRKTEF